MDERRSDEAVVRRLRMQDPSPDRLARAPVRLHNSGRPRSGDGDLARRMLRLVTLAMLFLLAVMTGMLLPPTWVVGH